MDYFIVVGYYLVLLVGIYGNIKYFVFKFKLMLEENDVMVYFSGYDYNL